MIVLKVAGSEIKGEGQRATDKIDLFFPSRRVGHARLEKSKLLSKRVRKTLQMFS